MQAPLATQDDYRAYLQDDDAEVDALTLRRASLVIRSALIGWTFFEVHDDTDLPTDERVAGVLAEAVCAQLAWWDEVGENGTGSSDQFQSTSLLGVSYTRGYSAAGSGTGAARGLCAEAYDVLVTGGMFTPSVTY